MEADDFCELSQFSTHNGIAKCEDVNVKINGELWIQLFTTNHWIFVIEKTITIRQTCEGSLDAQVTLSDIGMLKLDKGCMLETNSTVIQSTIELRDQKVINFKFSKINLNFTENSKKKFPLNLLDKTVTFKDHSVFTGLEKKLKEAGAIKLLDLEEHTHSSPWEIFTNFGTIYKIVVLTIFLIFIVCMFKIILTLYKCIIVPFKWLIKCVTGTLYRINKYGGHKKTQINQKTKKDKNTGNKPNANTIIEVNDVNILLEEIDGNTIIEKNMGNQRKINSIFI
jgi:hypothetical protein